MNKFYNNNRPPYAVGYRPSASAGAARSACASCGAHDDAIAACESCDSRNSCDSCERIPHRRESVCHDGCGSSVGSKNGLVGKPLGSVYAPLQDFGDLYEPQKAIERGTLFAELDLPFEGKTVKGGGCRG
jgi:hypothetical protein